MNKPRAQRSDSASRNCGKIKQTSRRVVNWRLLLVSTLLFVVALPLSYTWKQFQVHRTVGRLLETAAQLEQEGRWQEATNTLLRYLMIDPGNVNVMCRMATDVGHTADSPAARGRLVTLQYRIVGHAENPTDLSDVRLDLAKNLIQQRRFIEAADQVKALRGDLTSTDDASQVESRARSLWASTQHGLLVSGKDIDVAELAEAFEFALLANLHDVELATNAARFYRENTDKLSQIKAAPIDGAAKADRVIEKLVIHNGENPDVYLARYRYQQQYAAPSDDDLARALAVAPDHVEVLYLAAREATQDATRESFDRAEELLRHIIDISEKRQLAEPHAYVVLSQLIAATPNQSSDSTAAVDVLKRGRRVAGDDNLEINLALATAHIKSKNLDEAGSLIKRNRRLVEAPSLQITRTQRVAILNRVRLAAAQLDLARGEHTAAAAELNRILASSEQTQQGDVSSTPLQAMQLLARVMEGAGRWDVASQYWEQLLAQLPGVPLVELSAARAYTKCGNQQHAVEYFNAAIKGFERADDSLPAHQTAGSTNTASQSQHREHILQIRVELAQAMLHQQLTLPQQERDWDGVSNLIAQMASQATEHDSDMNAQLRLLETDYLMAKATPEDHGRVDELLDVIEANFAHDSEVLVRLSRAYLVRDDIEGARRAMDEYVSQEPLSTRRALTQSSFFHHIGEIDSAEKVLRQAIDQLGDDDRDQLVGARVAILIASDQLNEAARLCRVEIDEHQSGTTFIDAALDVALLKQDFEWAGSLVEALNRDDGTVDEFTIEFARARHMMALYQTLDAARRYELRNLVDRVRALRPRWYQAVAIHARHAELSGELEQAVRGYESAVEMGDRRPAVMQSLIAALYRRGRYDDAERYIEWLIASPIASEFIDSLAIERAVRREGLKSAIDLAATSLEHGTVDGSRHVRLALLLERDGQTTRALQTLVNATDDVPDDVDVWNALFALQLRSATVDEARATIQRLKLSTEVAEATQDALLGPWHEQLGETETALAHYRASLSKNQDDLENRLRLANLLTAVDVVQAKSQFKEILRLAPKHAEAMRRYAIVLAASGDSNDWAQAEQLLKAIGADQQGHSDERLRAILLSRKPGTKAERHQYLIAARDITQNKLATSPSGDNDTDRLLLANVYERLAVLNRDMASLNSAREQWRRLVDRGSPRFEYLSQYVVFLLRNATLDDTSLHQGLLESTARAAFIEDALRRLATMERMVSHSFANKAQAFGPRTTVILLQAQATHAAGNTAQAVRDLTVAASEWARQLTNESEKARLYLSIGNACASMQQYEQAEHWHRELVSILPDSYVVLAQTLANQGKANEAIEVCLKAAKTKNDPQVATNLARLLTGNIRDDASYQRLQPLFKQVLQGNSANTDLLMALGVLATSHNNSIDATRYFQRVIELEPSNAVALNNLATMYAEIPDRYEEALRYIDRAIQTAGRRASLLLDTRGTILMRQGRYEEAKRELEEAVVSDGSDPRYHFHLAAAYTTTGEFAEAHAALTDARRLGLANAVLTDGDREMLAQLDVQLTSAAVQGVN